MILSNGGFNNVGAIAQRAILDRCYERASAARELQTTLENLQARAEQLAQEEATSVAAKDYATAGQKAQEHATAMKALNDSIASAQTEYQEELLALKSAASASKLQQLLTMAVRDETDKLLVDLAKSEAAAIAAGKFDLAIERRDVPKLIIEMQQKIAEHEASEKACIAARDYTGAGDAQKEVEGVKAAFAVEVTRIKAISEAFLPPPLTLAALDAATANVLMSANWATTHEKLRELPPMVAQLAQATADACAAGDYSLCRTMQALGHSLAAHAAALASGLQEEASAVASKEYERAAIIAEQQGTRSETALGEMNKVAATHAAALQAADAALATSKPGKTTKVPRGASRWGANSASAIAEGQPVAQGQPVAPSPARVQPVHPVYSPSPPIAASGEGRRGEGAFRSGFCAVHTDCKTFCAAWWCYCCVIGQLHEKVFQNRGACQRITTYALSFMALAMVLSVVGVGVGVMVVVMVRLVVWLTAVRAHVRETEGIPGNPCCDCCLSYWFMPCVASQLLRHMRIKGKRYRLCTPTGEVPEALIQSAQDVDVDNENCSCGC